jgi:regulator of RNase E activity RraA
VPDGPGEGEVLVVDGRVREGDALAGVEFMEELTDKAVDGVGW